MRKGLWLLALLVSGSLGQDNMTEAQLKFEQAYFKEHYERDFDAARALYAEALELAAGWQQLEVQVRRALDDLDQKAEIDLERLHALIFYAFQQEDYRAHVEGLRLYGEDARDLLGIALREGKLPGVGPTKLAPGRAVTLLCRLDVDVRDVLLDALVAPDPYLRKAIAEHTDPDRYGEVLFALTEDPNRQVREAARNTLFLAEAPDIATGVQWYAEDNSETALGWLVGRAPVELLENVLGREGFGRKTRVVELVCSGGRSPAVDAGVMGLLAERLHGMDRTLARAVLPDMENLEKEARLFRDDAFAEDVEQQLLRWCKAGGEGWSEAYPLLLGCGGRATLEAMVETGWIDERLLERCIRRLPGEELAAVFALVGPGEMLMTAAETALAYHGLSEVPAEVWWIVAEALTEGPRATEFLREFLPALSSRCEELEQSAERMALAQTYRPLIDEGFARDLDDDENEELAECLMQLAAFDPRPERIEHVVALLASDARGVRRMALHATSKAAVEHPGLVRSALVETLADDARSQIWNHRALHWRRSGFPEDRYGVLLALPADLAGMIISHVDEATPAQTCALIGEAMLSIETREATRWLHDRFGLFPERLQREIIARFAAELYEPALSLVGEYSLHRDQDMRKAADAYLESIESLRERRARVRRLTTESSLQDQLFDLLDTGSATVAAGAAKALGKLGDRTLVPALLQRLEARSEPAVTEAIEAAVAELLGN